MRKGGERKREREQIRFVKMFAEGKFRDLIKYVDILYQDQILNRFNCVHPSVCSKHTTDRENEAVNQKFDRNIAKNWTQVSIENGPNRKKDAPTLLREVTTPLLF